MRDYRKMQQIRKAADSAELKTLRVIYKATTKWLKKVKAEAKKSWKISGV